VASDPSNLENRFKELIRQLALNGVPDPCHISILLKYFLAMLLDKAGKSDEAVVLSEQLVESDIEAYFGHTAVELVIEPMLIIVNHRFDKLLIQIDAEEAHDRGSLIQAVETLARRTEGQILAILGPKSEKLTEVFCIYSFFAFERGDPAEGLDYQ